MAQIFELCGCLREPWIFLGWPSRHVSYYPSSRPRAVMAEYRLFHVRVVSAVFDKRFERLSRSVYRAAFLRRESNHYRLGPFLALDFGELAACHVAGFVSTEYRRTVRRRMLMVPVATTLTML